MMEPTVDQYLIANCLSIIDEFNIMYAGRDKKTLKKEADEKYNEMDIAVKIAYPFRQTVHFTVGESKKNRNVQKINHDLYIEQHDFRIEIKYLKNWLSSSDTWSASKTWDVFQKDFDWLMDEIDANGNGKVAFVIGWFNCVDSISQLIQLGKGSGAYPLVDEKKLAYFPFLEKTKEPTQTRDLKYNYETCAYKKWKINHIGTRNGDYNCMFLGNEDDYFHFAIYY